MCWNNIYLLTIYLFVIIYAQNDLSEDENVSVDAENPRITGVKAIDIHSQIEIKAFKWSLGVAPYYIDVNTDSIIARRIQTAMRMIESASCVVFKSLNNVPSRTNSSWLHFTNPSQERECIHEPQISEDGEVRVVLGFDCMQRRDVVHAILHGLGFRDEVSHPQRDQYIRILWQNVQPKYRSLFRIKLEEDRSKTLVEYDPMSIMHFHDRAFSINGGATIAPLVPGLIISPSENLSQLDKMKLRLNFAHECNKRKVGDILDTCKNVLHDSPGSKQKSLLQEVDTKVGYSVENDGDLSEYDDGSDSVDEEEEAIVPEHDEDVDDDDDHDKGDENILRKS